MIVNALKTALIEGDGKFYKQPAHRDPPRPQHSFDGASTRGVERGVGRLGAKLGAHMVMFADGHGRCGAGHRARAATPRNITARTAAGHADRILHLRHQPRRDRGGARPIPGKFVESNFYHYEFLGEHFKTVKGYDAISRSGDRPQGRHRGRGRRFMRAASWGTPTRSCAGSKSAGKSSAISSFNVAFRFGRHAYEVASGA